MMLDDLPCAKTKRLPATGPSVCPRLLLAIFVSLSALILGPSSAPAQELHPEAFVGAVTSRTDDRVSLSVEPDTEFGRQENLWVYQKRDAIQVGGVVVKVNWARVGRLRIDSLEGDLAEATIVQEYSGSSVSIGDEVGRLPNTPPKIISVTADSTDVRPMHEVSIFVNAVDDEGDALRYTARITGGTLLGADEQSPVIKWIAPEHPGIYRITISVKDERGAGAGQELVMTVPRVLEADPYKLVSTFGGNNRAYWQFGEVTDIGLDEADNTWVLDAKSRLLRVRGSTGAEIGDIDLTFGKSATGVAPSKISLGYEGFVYVLDVSHKILRRLDRTGKRATVIFNGSTRKTFLLEEPSDIASTKSGDVLVTDSAAGHVSVIDREGRFVLLFGAQGSGKGELLGPVSITTNEYGDIYVLDSAKGEIVEFDPAYRFRKSYRCPMQGPDGKILADARSGSIYVLDSEAGSVRRLGPDGKLQVLISPIGGKDKSGPSATAIALRSDGYILVGTENASIWEFDPSGTLRGILGEEKFGKIADIAASDDGQLFVLDSSVAQVNRFDRHRWLKGRFGAKGKYQGQFLKPEKLSVDGDGNCYVFDGGRNSIQKFYATGVFSKVIPIGKDVAGSLKDATDVDVTGNGDIYILDGKRKAVFILSREGELKKIVPLTSSDARKSEDIRRPKDIAVDEQGFIYISDPTAYAVYKFHPEGTRINKLGGKGQDAGHFGKIADLAADGKGFVYVLLKDRRVVAKFNRDGRFIMEIPLAAGKDTPLKTPEIIAVDSRGALYAYDNYYKAVFKFMQ